MYIDLDLNRVRQHADYIEEEIRLARRLTDQLRGLKSACVEPAQMRHCDELCDKLNRLAKSMKRRQELMGDIVSVMSDVKAQVRGENEEIVRLLRDIED